MRDKELRIKRAAVRPYIMTRIAEGLISGATMKLGYNPYGEQVLFHASKSRLRGLVGGFRSGKTLAGANEAIKWSKVPGTFGWIVGPDYPMLRQAMRDFFKLLPKYLIKHWDKHEKVLTLWNRSIIEFKSADSPERLAAVPLDWYWLDEAALCKEDTLDMLDARTIDKSGYGWLTTTPRGYDKVYDTLFNVEKKVRYAEGWKLSTLENPYISNEEKERLKERFSGQFFKQYVLGECVTHEGKVYDLTKEIHQIEVYEFSGPEKLVYGVDWGHTVSPTVEVVIYVNEVKGKEVYTVVEAAYLRNKTRTFAAIEAIRMEGEHGRGVWKCDPAEPSSLDEFRDRGLEVEGGMNRILDGIAQVGSLFGIDKDVGGPRLRILRGERTDLIWEELQKYSFPRRNSDGRMPDKAFSHGPDAIRYGLANSNEERGYAIYEEVELSDIYELGF